MNDNYVLVYEFKITYTEFNEYLKSIGKEDYMNSIDKTISFPINELLSENGINSFNELEVASSKNVIGISVSDKSPDPVIIVKVYVDRNYEKQALEIINEQTSDEEPEELKDSE